MSLPSARSLDPTPIGISCLVLVALLFYGAFNVGDLPLVGGGTTYTATFSEAAGLKRGNDVVVGGVKVGKVDEVTLEDTTVRVAFTVKDARVGDDPHLRIGIGTLLGNKYLDLEPTGAGSWDPDERIPLDRTTAPYDVIPAFADLTKTVQQIDVEQLATAFTTLADTFRGAPPHVRGAVDGLTRLSTTIASRDAALSELLAHTEAVTGVLADRRTQLSALLGDGSLLLQELSSRHAAISELLRASRELAVQLRGLVDDNEQAIGPTLEQLIQVTTILERNRDDIEQFLQLIYPTTRMLVDSTGQGPWFDGILGGMTPVPEVPGLPVVAPQPSARTLGELLGIPSGTGS